MKRIVNILLGALAMLTVALLSAFISMRLAIHGREVEVPNLTNLSIPEASRQTAARGLLLTLENRFYSASVAPSRVLAQSPAPGTKVRREWAVRITESLGPQKVSVPRLVGQGERAATITLRRLDLEPGLVAHLPAPGSPGVVVAQSPPPDAEGVDSPRVSLLLSDPLSPDAAEGFVMPSLAGLTLRAAAARAAASGLHIASAEDVLTPQPASAPASSAAAPAPPSPSPVPSPVPSAPAATSPSSAVPLASDIDTVISQTPPAGYRVLKGEAVHITLAQAPSSPHP